MNLYFLVEGSRTEREVYPRWLSVLVPALTQVYDPFSVTKNNYYLFSSNGYPGIKGDIRAAVLDINDSGSYDYFLICLDSDDFDVDDKRREMEDAVYSLDVKLNATLIVVIQCRCIETWFLGNRGKYPRKANNDFLPYSRFYNVSRYNPELMEKPHWYSSSVSQFHAAYIKKMLLAGGKHYTKRNPYSVCGKSYVEELQKRVNGTMHLRSLKAFFDFCGQLNDATSR